MKRRVGWFGMLALMGASAVGAGPLASQDLADFDYENLAFRGFGLQVGTLFGTRVESTQTYGVRMDLGYLGPGLRIVPSVMYWSSEMKRGEVRDLERRVEALVDRQSAPGSDPAAVDLGTIDWADLVLGMDGHIVWSVPFGFLSYLGAGVAAHIQNGSGQSIEGTFVEDLLDSVTAGFNLHGGLEYPVGDHFRLYGSTRYEILGDLQYLELRVGGQIMFGRSNPGEVRQP